MKKPIYVMNGMEIEEFIEEPSSPQLLKRLSPEEKNILILQRQLKSGVEDFQSQPSEDSAYAIYMSLMGLGFPGEALYWARSPEQSTQALDLTRALFCDDSGWCDCGEDEVEVQVGSRLEIRATPNWIALQKVPNQITNRLDTLWKCTCCDHFNLTDQLPSESVRNQLEMRENFSKKGEGEDSKVLRKGCNGCPQE